MCSFSLTVTKNLSERRGGKSSEMSPVPMRSIGQSTKTHQHQQNRMSQVLQVPTVNLYPSRKKGLTKDHVTFSEYLQFTCLGRFEGVKAGGRSSFVAEWFMWDTVVNFIKFNYFWNSWYILLCFKRACLVICTVFYNFKTVNGEVLAPNRLLLYEV